MEERVQKAVNLFKDGFNCSQSVFAAFADIYGLTFDQSLLVSSSFGGGIGRMRETCGAACALFILAGLENGSTDPKDREAKSANYKFVQELAEIFRKRNGALKCFDLLKLKENSCISPIPDERTPQYYARRPCVRIIEVASEMWNTYLKEKAADKQ